MAEVINFRRAKKRHGRTAKEREASLNRARFGTPKAQRNVTLTRSEKERSDLDGKKLDPHKPRDR